MTALLREESAEYGVIAAGWSDGPQAVPVSSRGVLDGRGPLGRVLRTRRRVRVDDYDEVGGAVADQMRRIGVRSPVAGTVVVGGRIWGARSAAWPTGAPLPEGGEDRVAEFAELIFYAIDNVECDRTVAATSFSVLAGSATSRWAWNV